MNPQATDTMGLQRQISSRTHFTKSQSQLKFPKLYTSFFLYSYHSLSISERCKIFNIDKLSENYQFPNPPGSVTKTSAGWTRKLKLLKTCAQITSGNFLSFDCVDWKMRETWYRALMRVISVYCWKLVRCDVLSETRKRKVGHEWNEVTLKTVRFNIGDNFCHSWLL